jgi:GNAT superfamily N-acetyltransferase
MLFPDIALAQRLEYHEAWSSSEHARTQAYLYPETGADTLPLGDGCLVFCGKKSPLSQAYGLGLSGPISTTELETIETFYRSRELKPRVQACTLADPSLFQLLGENHYIVQDYMNVYARQLDAFDERIPLRSDLNIQIASPDDAKRWYELNNVSGDWAEPDGLAFMLIRTTLKADTQLFLAWLHGELVGGGGLEIHNGVAALMAADTLPAFRKHGIHTALVHARVDAAVKAGCDLAMVHTRPGAVSQRNVLRAGFQLVYNEVTMISPS